MLKYNPLNTAKDAIANQNIDENETYTLDSSNSKGLFSSDYISGTKLLDIIKNNTILRRAMLNYINVGKVDCHDNPLYDVNYGEEYAHAVYKKCTEGMSLSLCITVDSNCVKNDLLKQFPKKLENWITKDSYEKHINDLDSMFKNNCQNKICVPFAKELNKLHDQLDNLDFVVHYGCAGSGKSTAIIQQLKDKDKEPCAIVTLSNTIGNMFKQKVKQIDTYSCAKMTYSLMKRGDKMPKYEHIVIDEFSQWGFDQLSLLIKIIEKYPEAKYYIMGDIDQIPTFLSSGSLLYSVIKEYPSKCIAHNTCYRSTGQLAYDIENLRKGKLSFNILPCNDDLLKHMDCIVTGSNAHVKRLNDYMLKLKFNCHLYSSVAEQILNLKNEDVELICNTTTQIDGTKIYTNERFTCVYDGCVYNLISYVDPSKRFYIRPKDSNRLRLFDFGYAITVNKAQGLEWDNVCVYLDYFDPEPKSKDLNVQSANSIYVALSRGRHTTVITTNGTNIERMRQAIARSVNNKYEFFNNFVEAKTIRE